MALTATEIINEALNIWWRTFKIKIDFFGKLYILYKNIQKHYYTIIVQLVKSSLQTILAWEYTNKPQH